MRKIKADSIMVMIILVPTITLLVNALFAISSSMRAMLLLILVIASLAFFPQKDMFIAINLFLQEKSNATIFVYETLNSFGGVTINTAPKYVV
ncbi:hypothetical protein [Lacticaseibacillus paracasei]|uniref:hypothetical protein n=1 Tax=Lacticaseibacillus paracasei TaxID=1597 RepID=UPI0018A61E73|nr:hypothetical protein [Lacticaseibacillus paracasei]QOP48772.1 hypothetical protein G5C68_11145 [Lacticaseibacillus paracasei]